MTETEQLKYALNLVIAQRNMTMNQLVDLEVTLATVRAELAEATKLKEDETKAEPEKAN